MGNTPFTPFNRYARSIIRLGGAATIDQALFSGSNFLTIALVGRFAGSAELGRYSLAWSLVLLATAIQRALVTAPYTYQCQELTNLRRRLRRGSALVQATLTTIVLAMLVAVGVAVSTVFCEDSFVSAGLLAGFAVAWGIQDCCRRVLFADHCFGEVALIDGMAASLQIGCLVCLAIWGQLTATTALLTMTLSTGVIAGMWLCYRQSAFLIRRRSVRRDSKAAWRFGRWAALSEATFTGQDFGVQAMLAASGGYTVAGAFAACMSLVRLANPFVQAVGNAVGPLSARAFAAGGLPKLRHGVGRVTRLMAAVMLSYLVIIVFVGPTALVWIYGSEHQNEDRLLVILAVATAIAALGLAPAKAVSALQRPRLNLLANALRLTITLTIGWVTYFSLAAYGVALAILIGTFVSVMLKWWLYSHITRVVVVTPEAV